MAEAEKQELRAETLHSRQTNAGLVELQTHLVDLFLLALKLFPPRLERLCLVECVLGLRP